jgi:archaellum biogenesis protein FlaJ (TadC family)
MSIATAAIAPRSTAEGRRTNYLAIFVGAILAFVVASVYYGVIFSDLWLQVRQLNPTSIGEVSTSPVQPFIEFLKTLVIALAIGHLVTRLGVKQVKGALQLGALLFLAFPGMLWVGAMMWENTPWQFAALHGGDWLIKCLLFTLIPAVSRR